MCWQRRQFWNTRLAYCRKRKRQGLEFRAKALCQRVLCSIRQIMHISQYMHKALYTNLLYFYISQYMHKALYTNLLYFYISRDVGDIFHYWETIIMIYAIILFSNVHTFVWCARTSPNRGSEYKKLQSYIKTKHRFFGYSIILTICFGLVRTCIISMSPAWPCLKNYCRFPQSIKLILDTLPF